MACVIESPLCERVYKRCSLPKNVNVLSPRDADGLPSSRDVDGNLWNDTETIYRPAPAWSRGMKSEL